MLLTHCDLVTQHVDGSLNALWRCLKAPQSVLTYHQMCTVVFTWQQFQRKHLWTRSVTCVFGDYMFKITTAPTPQWFKLDVSIDIADILFFTCVSICMLVLSWCVSMKCIWHLYNLMQNLHKLTVVLERNRPWDCIWHTAAWIKWSTISDIQMHFLYTSPTCFVCKYLLSHFN